MGVSPVLSAWNQDAPAYRLGTHFPIWVHDQDNGCIALTCLSDGCTFPRRPRIAYRLAHDAMKSGSNIGALAEPHLDEFLEWHQQEGRTE